MLPLSFLCVMNWTALGTMRAGKLLPRREIQLDIQTRRVLGYLEVGNLPLVVESKSKSKEISGIHHGFQRKVREGCFSIEKQSKKSNPGSNSSPEPNGISALRAEAKLSYAGLVLDWNLTPGYPQYFRDLPTRNEEDP